jgi:hypothetical protein
MYSVQMTKYRCVNHCFDSENYLHFIHLVGWMKNNKKYIYHMDDLHLKLKLKIEH